MRYAVDAEPRVFITCDIHAEKSLCEEVMNILFGYGIEAYCRWFPGRGFVVVHIGGEIDAHKVVKYLVSRHIRGYWVVPVDSVCRASYEDVARSVLNVVLLKASSLPIRIVGVCRKRGNAVDSCSNLLKYVGEYVERLGVAIVDFRGYTHIVRIEIVYDIALVSLYRSDEEEGFRVFRSPQRPGKA